MTETDIPTDTGEEPQPKRKTRWLRWFLILSVLVVVLFSIVVMLIPTMLSSGYVRRQLVTALSEELRGPVSIDQLDVSWAHGARIRGFRVGNPPEFEGGTAIAADSVRVDVSLSKLFDDVLELTLRLDKPELLVVRDKDGNTNFDYLTRSGARRVKAGGKPGSRPSEPSKSTRRKRSHSGGSWDYGPELDNVIVDFEITDGSIAIDDRLTGVKRSIDDIEVLVSNKAAGKPVEFSLEGKLADAHGAQDGQFSLTGQSRLTPGLPDLVILETGVELSAFEPILAAFLPEPFEAFRGRVHGDLELRVYDDEKRLELSGGLVGEGLRIVGGPLGEHRGVDIERARLEPRVRYSDSGGKVSIAGTMIDLGFAKIHSMTDEQVAKQFAGKPGTPIGLQAELDLAKLSAQPGLLAGTSGTGKVDLEALVAVPEQPESEPVPLRVAVKASGLELSGGAIPEGMVVPKQVSVVADGKLEATAVDLGLELGGDGIAGTGAATGDLDKTTKLQLDATLEQSTAVGLLQSFLPSGTKLDGRTRVRGNVIRTAKPGAAADYALDLTVGPPRVALLANQLDLADVKVTGPIDRLRIQTQDKARLNGGPLQLAVDLDTVDAGQGAEQLVSLKLGWHGGRAAYGLTPALRYAIPLFAGMPTGDVEKIAGIDFDAVANIELTAKGPIPRAGKTVQDLARWLGSGTIHLQNGGFTPAAALSGLLPFFHKQGRIDFRGLETTFGLSDGAIVTKAFRIGGKDGYLTLSGRTRLTGELAIGLDLSGLLAAHADGRKILAVVGKDAVKAQLGGTLANPALKIEDFARDAVQKGVENAAGSFLEGLLKGRKPKQALDDILKRFKK